MERVLAWCADEGLAAIPFGGGTSVVGGVEPRVGEAYAGVVTIDLGTLESRARGRRDLARGSHPGRRARPGPRGPASAERPHAAPLSPIVRVLDPRRVDSHAGRRPLRDPAHAHRRPGGVGARDHPCGGVGVTPPVPARAPGPAPTGRWSGPRGSSGWSPKRGCAFRHARSTSSPAGSSSTTSRRPPSAVRELSQSGLDPANCRLLDATEAEVTGAGPPGKALLVLGFESAHHPVDAWMDLARGGRPRTTAASPVRVRAAELA